RSYGRDGTRKTIRLIRRPSLVRLLSLRPRARRAESRLVLCFGFWRARIASRHRARCCRQERRELGFSVRARDRREPQTAQRRVSPAHALLRVRSLALEREAARVRRDEPVLEAEREHLG